MKTGKYVDIHCHILPGVDDGAPDLDVALQMLKQEAREGVGEIILTPHQKPGHWCVTAGGIEKDLAASRWKRRIWVFRYGSIPARS